MVNYITFLVIVLAAFLTVVHSFQEDVDDLELATVEDWDEWEEDELKRVKRSPDPDPRGARRKKKKKKTSSGVVGGGGGGADGADGSKFKPGDKTVYGEKGEVLIPYPIRTSFSTRLHVKRTILITIASFFAMLYARAN